MDLISQSIENVDELAKICINNNKNAVDNASIGRIHPNIHIYYNSVNIFVGPQGSGKTYSAMTEIIKISKVDPYAHLLVYFSKEGANTYDPTVESLKILLDVDIVYVRYDEAVDFVKKLLAYKALYDEIKNGHLESKIEQSQVDELYEVLHIKSLSAPILHTMFLFDDVSNNILFKQDSSYCNSLVSICRKIHTSFFMTIQYWKGVSPNIKANVTSAFIFGRFSKQQFRYICSQIATSIPFDELYNQYSQLNASDKLIINNRTNEVDIVTKHDC